MSSLDMGNHLIGKVSEPRRPAPSRAVVSLEWGLSRIVDNDLDSEYQVDPDDLFLRYSDISLHCC